MHGRQCGGGGEELDGEPRPPARAEVRGGEVDRQPVVDTRLDRSPTSGFCSKYTSPGRGGGLTVLVATAVPLSA